MGAIVGGEAIIETIRYMDVPYWTIYENEAKRTAGNSIAAYRPESEAGSESLEVSLSQLRAQFNRMQAGRYILTAFKKPGAAKGGVDTHIELGIAPSAMGQPGIAGMSAAPQPMYIDGVGLVTPDNLGASLEAWYNRKEAERKAREDAAATAKRIAELEGELKERNGTIQNGLYSIGAMLWPSLRKTPAVAEMLAVVAGNSIKSAPKSGAAGTAAGEADGNTAAGVGDGSREDRLAAAVATLDDPSTDVVELLESLAALKKNNPDTYEQGINFIRSME